MNAIRSGTYASADLYDLSYTWYREDIDFYVDLARRAHGPVLEAACGTGRVLLPTAQAGVDIDGFDLSTEMLAGLERKAKALGLSPRVREGDMRDFTMPRKYVLITIPFRAFMHLETSEDQVRALRCMREHLEPGGALVFNLFFMCSDLMRERDGQRTEDRRFTTDDGREAVLYTTSQYDRVNQSMSCDREVYVNGTEVGRYPFTLRWTYRFEMELLLRAAGFSRWDVRGGFDGRDLATDRDEMVWTAWQH